MSTIRLAFIVLLVTAALLSGQAAQPGLMMISIDGMRPDYVTAADLHHLKIPNHIPEPHDLAYGRMASQARHSE